MRLLIAVILAGASGLAVAQGDPLRAKNCVLCHDAEKQKVGPSLKDIRAKYKGDKSRAGDIAARMKDGKGHPKVAGSDAELRAAVEAALSAR